jgi:hypothetical protein
MYKVFSTDIIFTEKREKACRHQIDARLIEANDSLSYLTIVFVKKLNFHNFVEKFALVRLVAANLLTNLSKDLFS